jgi:protein-tyrosine sulfotransferase
MASDVGVARRDWPVFVVGAPRSGTTLTRFILDTHPDISCPPETKFLCGLQQVFYYPQVAFALRSLGFSQSQVCTEFGGLVRSLMGAYAARHGKRRWADKTPNYYRILPFIHEIFGGEVLYIFIVRHPFDVISSLVKIVNDGAAVEDPELKRALVQYGMGLHCWARYWTEVYEAIDVFRWQYPDCSYTMRYEDLVRNPEECAARMFSFLGEKFSVGMLEKVFNSPHDEGLGDLKIRRTDGIHDKSVGGWAAWETRLVDKLWQLVGPLASSFQYTKWADAPVEQTDTS